MGKKVDFMSLSKKALKMWGEGKLEEARETYQKAEYLIDTQNDAFYADFYSQIGSLLSQMKREEATHYFELSLREGKRDKNLTKLSLLHYFYGEHLLRFSKFSKAIEVVESLLSQEVKTKNLLLMIKAEALWNMGEKESAKQCAKEAIELSTESFQKERIREKLKKIESFKT